MNTILITFCVFFATVAFGAETAFEQDANLPIIYLNVAIKAGSTTDPRGQSGLTNFMGEMLLRGTKSRTKEQIDLALDQMGARLEVEARAEALIIRGAVLSSQLDRFLTLLTEIVTEPSFPEAEIRKLKSEIVSGILEELGRDSTLAMRRFTKFLFRDHPYGKPVLGVVKDIQQMTQAQIQAHYDRLIRDKYLLIVGSGDAPSTVIGKWANEIGRKRPDLANGLVDSLMVPNPEDAPTRRLQLVDKPDRTQTQINIGQMGIRMTDPHFFPIFVGNHAFGGGSFSARLMTEIRVKRGWSYGANSYFRHGRRPRSWQAHLFPASKDTVNALQLTLKMIEEVREKGITQDEFSFSQESLVNSSGFMYDTPRKRVENKLLERTLDLPDGFMKSYGAEIGKVTLGEVNSALKQYLKPDRLAVSVLCTAKDLQAALASISGVSANQVVVTPYTEE